MKNFKKLALKHQIMFRDEVLEVSSVKGYPAIISEEAAKEGKIFYQGMDGFLEIVQNRYEYSRRKDMYSNMLRSEHIPFNFFVPFILKNNRYLKDILNILIPDLNISAITCIKIEWAPPEKEKYLDDLTSFDVYVQGLREKKEIGIGIEVKYTEKSYPYGKTEKQKMSEPKKTSIYHIITELSGLFNRGSIERLIEKDIKQIWRNHLLGASMVLNGEIEEFYSIHIYPSGNTYQKQAANTYKSQLSKKGSRYFIDISYEEYFDVCEKVFKNDDEFMKWVKYLRERYILKNN